MITACLTPIIYDHKSKPDPLRSAISTTTALEFRLKSGRPARTEQLKKSTCCLDMLYILFKTFELFMTCIFLFKGNYSEHSKTCFYIATDQIKLGEKTFTPSLLSYQPSSYLEGTH